MALLVFLMTMAATLAALSGYCNSMGKFGYGPRTSKAFPPGWNGLTVTPHLGWRSWYAFYTQMNQAMIEEQIEALAAKNRTIKGWEGNVSLCDLGYCSVGIDEGWEGWVACCPTDLASSDSSLLHAAAGSVSITRNTT